MTTIGTIASVAGVGLMPLPLLALVVAVAVAVVILRWYRASEDEPATLEEEIEAGIELHEIRRRLEVAKARAEIHRNGDSLRQKIVEELRERRP